MHCSNLDTLVNNMNSMQLSPSQVTLPVSNQGIVKTKEDEDVQILKMVLDVGIFVLEGRLPQHKAKRGFVEGPHCVLQPQTQTHRCDYNNYVCERARKYRRLMESIWNENKNLCIELRVCADCSCGEQQVWKNSVSRFDYVLEQWCFEITNVRNNEEDIGVMNWYGLLQAIRSQIHFSQLSAWWSSNRAQLPKNIAFRVLPLTQIDANCCSIQHTFPALIFNSTYLQVKVKSQPRSEMLPKIHCPVHCNQDNVVDDRMKIHCDRLGKHHCQALEDTEENEIETWFNPKNSFYSGFMKTDSIGNIVDKDHTKNVKSVKYHSNEVSESKNDECFPVHFPTFQRHSNNSTPCYSIYSHSKNVSHPSSVLQKPSIPVTAFELERKRSDFSSSSCCSDNRHRESIPFNICNKLNSDGENQVPQFRKNSTLHHTQLPDYSYDKEGNSRPSTEKEKYSIFDRKQKISDCEFCHMESKDKESSNEVEDRRSDFLPTKVTKSVFDDKNAETELLRKSLACKDKSDNHLDMVKIKGNSSDTRKNSTQLGKMVVVKGGFEQKSNKRTTAAVKQYFRTKRSSIKPPLPPFGNIIESILSGRIYFSQVVDNFKIKITSCFPFRGDSVLPASAYYYHFGDVDLSRSYLVKSKIPEREKGIQILSVGQLQVSVFNTENSPIKVFIIPYDLTDMPRCTKTYIRHSNYYAPSGTTNHCIKWLQSLIQFKCFCSKSGRLYLQNEINIIIFQKSDFNTACALQQRTELKHHNVTEIAYK